MRILWFTWKDGAHPQAGGAETVNEEIASRLVRDGHEVTFLTAGFVGAAPEETRDGFRVIRLGGRWTVYWRAFRYYRKHLRGWADLIVEEVNTVPFFTRWYAGDTKVVLLFYQLCREIWFYQMPFPLSVAGYALEWAYLHVLAATGGDVLTISESTRADLARYGFDPGRTRVFPVGVRAPAISSLEAAPKDDRPSLLYVGSLRPMKRPLHALAAFEAAKREVPDLVIRFVGGGDARDEGRLRAAAERSPYRADISFAGRVSEERKLEFMRRAQLLVVTSVKEGWGLVVTEANGQGTPAAVYDVDGLRDAVEGGKIGVLCPEMTPVALGRRIAAFLNDRSGYTTFRRTAWEHARRFTFERCYEEFIRLII